MNEDASSNAITSPTTLKNREKKHCYMSTNRGCEHEEQFGTVGGWHVPRVKFELERADWDRETWQRGHL
jgi:hypothetical protein